MNGNQQYVLAIDLGTSGPKVALATLEGQIIEAGSGTSDVILLPNGGAEQDPDAWWAEIKRVTHELLAKRALARERIVAVSCTTQWSGTVPVDKDGNHLSNAIIWLDSRGAKHIAEVTGGLIKIDKEGYRHSCKTQDPAVSKTSFSGLGRGAQARYKITDEKQTKSGLLCRLHW